MENPIEPSPIAQIILEMKNSGLYTLEEIRDEMARLGITPEEFQPFIVKGNEALAPKKPVTTTTSHTDFDEEAAARAGEQTVASRTANEIMKRMNEKRTVPPTPPLPPHK